MTRSLLRPLAALLALLVVTACATTQEAGNQPAVPKSPLFFWKVSQDGRPGTVYLLGTAHFRDAKSATLDRAVLERVDAADELVFEIAPDGTNTEAVQAATKELGLLPEGESLLERLDDATRENLVETSQKLGLPLEVLSRMRPWLAGITFTVLRMKLEGYSEEAGTERLLLARARALGGQKQVSSLETAEEQLRIFASLPDDTQAEMLREVLEGMGEERDHFEQIQRAYASGDEAALSAILFEGRSESPEAEAFYRALFDERNARMVERLLPYFAKDQETVIAVGAGHMLGEQSIPALLLAQGFRVEPVLAQGLAPVRPEGGASAGAFSDAELGFSAEFHGEPKVMRQQVPTPGGGTADFIIVTANEGLLELSVMVNVFPTPLDGNPELLGAMFDGMVARMGEQFGVLEENERLTVQGSPAARFVARSPTHRVEGVLVVRGARMYTLLASRAGEASERAEVTREETAKRFLDSFRLLEGEAQAPEPHGGRPVDAAQDEEPLSL